MFFILLVIWLLVKSNLIKLIAKNNKLMKLVIIKNEGLTYLRGLERGELKEDGIPTKKLLVPLEKQQKTQQLLIILNWQVLQKILRLKTF